MKLNDIFAQKVAAETIESVTKKQIRAAMHASAGYEELFDRLAQAGDSFTNRRFYPIQPGDPQHPGNCKDCNITHAPESHTLEVNKKYKHNAQAGGPNMLQTQDAPMAPDTDVNDVTDKWPEQDILRQVQDLRGQGMQEPAIFKQLMEMQVLGTPSPTPQDMTYIKSIMKSAAVDPKRQKELEQIEQFKKKKLKEQTPTEDIAPDTSAPKPSEVNMIDQDYIPPEPEQVEPPANAPNLDPNMPKEEALKIASSFFKYVKDLQAKQSILLGLMLEADNPTPFAGGEDTPTPADKKNLRKSIAINQIKISRAGDMFKRLVKLVGKEAMDTVETQWLQEQLNKSEDPMEQFVSPHSQEWKDIQEKEKEEARELRKSNPPPSRTDEQRAEDRENRQRYEEIRRLKDLHPEDHPGYTPRVKTSPKKPSQSKELSDKMTDREKSQYLDEILQKIDPEHKPFTDPVDEEKPSSNPNFKRSPYIAPPKDAPGYRPPWKKNKADAQLGNDSAGTAASPIDGQRDSLSSPDIDGTGKIGQGRPKLSPDQLKKMMIDHGNADAFKAQPGKVPEKKPVLPPPTDQQVRQQEFQEHMPKGKFGQAAPPAGPPAPPGAPPAAPLAAPPAGPPGAEEEMGMEDDMPVEDMRSLVEVMSDLEEDVNALQEKLEAGESILHGQEVEPVEDDTGSIPSGPPKIAVDEAAKDYYKSYYKDYGKQLTDDRVASVIDLIDEVGTHYGSGLKSADINRVAKYVISRPRHQSEFVDEKLTKLSDKILISYMFKSGAVHDAYQIPASTMLKFAILNTPGGSALVKYAEGKMKTPKPKGQPDDAVKLDKMKDKAGDDDVMLARPAHLPMKVEKKDHDDVHQFLEIEWDAKSPAAKRSDAGMAQAVISFVKGLESKKEFCDMGFLGQITIDELDIDGGSAIVHFRTQNLHGPLRTDNE